MEDPDLNRNLEETKELHARWSQFRDFFQMAIKGSKVTPQAETKFLELKTRIAMLHDGFLQALTHDHKVGQNVLSILAQCILLRRIPQLSQAESQKLEFDWNEAYLLMTETIANLEEEKESLKDVSEGAYKMRKARDRITTSVHNFFIGPVFKLIVAVACLVALVFAPPFLGFDYMEVKNKWSWTAPVYDRVVAVMRFFNSDLRYLSIADVKMYEIKEDYYRPAHGLVQNVNAQWFETQLPLMGFCEADLKEVQAIFQRRVPNEFQKEGRRLFAARAHPLHAYYFLLATSDDAKRFTELRRRCLEQKKIATQTDKVFNICRKANFIAIFSSAQDELRLNFPQDKFRFKPGQVNL